MAQLIIKPKTNFEFLNFSELLQFRELFYIFSWRDLKVRYKQTFLGISWVVFQPLITMLIFTTFFGNLVKISSENLPYPLFVLIGLTFWIFFVGGLTHASNSLIENENLIKKVYFPRIILPISAILTNLIDFAITFILLVLAILFFHRQLSLIFFTIVILGCAITSLATLGLGLLLSSFNVKYRDVRYILPFFIQTLLFVSPVIYPISAVSSHFRYLLAINPITGVIESVRATLGNTNVELDILLISTLSSAILLVVGLLYFRATEKFFADIV